MLIGSIASGEDGWSGNGPTGVWGMNPRVDVELVSKQEAPPAVDSIAQLLNDRNTPFLAYSFYFYDFTITPDCAGRPSIHA